MNFILILCVVGSLISMGESSSGSEGPFGGWDQSVAVKGALLCNGKPAVGVKVKLYDNDRTDIDDEMDQGVTDKFGQFQLEGTENEITTIDPKVNIYHNCKDEGYPCDRKISITIPDDYIVKGDRYDRVYDIGTLNLEGEIDGESRDCIN